VKLYHYTCQDRAELIDRDLTLKPGPDGVLWLTDLEHPYREALGLTSHSLSCDRTECGYVVDVPDQPGLQQAAGVLTWRWIRSKVDPALREGLESAPGVLPLHWWVSTVPLACEKHR